MSQSLHCIAKVLYSSSSFLESSEHVHLYTCKGGVAMGITVTRSKTRVVRRQRSSPGRANQISKRSLLNIKD